MASQGKEYAIVAVPAPGTGQSRGWKAALQGLETGNAGAGTATKNH